MNLHNQYLYEARGLNLGGALTGSRHVGWKSPSNIALIKYWGKYGNQMPMNPSLSFCLRNSFTETAVEFSMKKGKKSSVSFAFEGRRQPEFEERIRRFIESSKLYLPFLGEIDLNIESLNSFPHSAGIASSASGFSALSLCLVSIERSLFSTQSDPAGFFRKASFLSRLGSGSAARSVYKDYVLWGHETTIQGSSDEVAIELTLPRKVMPRLGDAILITGSGEKSVSSSAGHQLMQGHPFAEARMAQARKNLLDLIKALEAGDKDQFVRIAEHEALTLHALMMSSLPGYNLMNENTWKIIREIRKFREKENLFTAFTLDAGPNVHFLYDTKDRKTIESFINEKLLKYCEHESWIDDEAGSGPVELN